jgi:hypothetical protein
MIRYSNTKRVTVGAAWVNGLTHLDIYTGTQPAANGEVPGGSILLGTVSAIVWTAGATPGTQEVTGSTKGTAVASGTPGWGRFRNAGGTEFFDGAYGQEFSLVGGGDIVQGGDVELQNGSSHGVPAGSG